MTVKERGKCKYRRNVEENVTGVKKRGRELRVGDAYWRDGKKWVYRERKIDRARDG